MELLAGLLIGIATGVILSAAALRALRGLLRVPAEPAPLPSPARNVDGRELAELRRRLEAVLDAGGDGALAVDGSLHVCFANAAVRDLLELDHGCAEQSAVVVFRDHAVYAALKAALSDGRRRSLTFSSTRGSHLLQATIVPLTGAGDWAALVLLHDVTEARRLESVRRDFISNVSHELRTPLASIKATVDALQSGGMEDRVVADRFLQSVGTETDRMIHLVEELMELARIESGQVPFRFEPVDPAELVQDCSRRMVSQADRKGVQLTIEAGADLPLVRADADRLCRALLNLVQNAVKFTPAGGRIAVRVAAQAGEVAIGVEDNGIGIAADELGRIFERFYKVERARGSDGTGLGLAIVKHTVEAHGGSVSVSSRLGSGSTFRLLLPAYQPEAITSS